jgi:hypothetical protein
VSECASAFVSVSGSSQHYNYTLECCQSRIFSNSKINFGIKFENKMNKTARRNMLFLIFLLLVTYVHSQELVVKRCTASQYFDITSLQCYECVDSTETKSQNKVPSKTHIDKYGNSLSCTCAPGYIELRTACGSGTPANSLNICPKFTCSQCPKDEAPTLDKTDCLPCAAPSVVVNGVTQTPSDGSTFSTETKECSCGTKAGIAKHLVERDPYTNTFFRYKKCLSCPSKELVLAPKTDPYMCSACPHPNMTFDSTTLSCTCQPSSVFETVGLASYGNQNCIYKTEVYSGSQGAEASQLSYWTVQETADYYYWPPQEGKSQHKIKYYCWFSFCVIIVSTVLPFLRTF